MVAPILSSADLDHFDQDGYLLLRSVIDEAEISSLRCAMVEVLNNPVKEDRNFGYHPWKDEQADEANPYRLTYVNDLFAIHSKLDSHMKCDKLARIFLDLYSCDVCAFQSAAVIKPPHSNMEYLGWHQDAPDYTPLTNFKLSSALTYLSDMGPDTGGTSFIRGSHRWGLFEREWITVEGWPVPKRIVAGLDPDDHDVVSPQFEAGDVLIFHPCVIHKANSNKTDESKIGLINAYRATDCIDLTERNTFKADNIFITQNREPLICSDDRYSEQTVSNSRSKL